MPQSLGAILAQSQIEIDNAKAARGDTLRRNLSVNEVCDGIGISRSYFYRLCAQGRGPRVKKLGRRTFVTRADFDTWTASFNEFESRAA